MGIHTHFHRSHKLSYFSFLFTSLHFLENIKLDYCLQNEVRVFLYFLYLARFCQFQLLMFIYITV